MLGASIGASKGLERARLPVIAALGVVLAAPLGLAPSPAQAFLDSVNPFADTKDEFKGKYIDSLDPGPWQKPLDRIMAEQAADGGQAATRRRASSRAGEDDELDDPASGSKTAEPKEPPTPLPDGLTLLRISEQSLPHSPGWDGYLKAIGARLLAKSPVTGAPVRFHVTASEDYGTAKAFPDGAVGIPLGLLRQVDSEDEFAFVLAHESAHVILGHHDNDWYQSMNQNLVSAAEVALGLGVTLAAKLGKNEFAGEAAKVALIAAGALFVTDTGLFPSFTREQEDEADLLGFDLLVRAGYNADGAFDAFRRFVAWEEALAARPDPRDAQRTELEQDIQDSASQGAVQQAVNGVLQALSLAAEDAKEAIGVTHRSAAEREESLLDYFLREYAEEAPPDMSVARLNGVRTSADSQALFEAYTFAWKALAQVDDGKLRDAENLSRKAVSGRFKTDPLSRFAFYRTRFEQRQFDKAGKNLELALQGPNPPLIVYRQLAELRWRQGQKAESMKILYWAFKDFQEPPELYADLIYRHHLLGDKKKAESMALKCKFKNRAAGKVCGKAAKGEHPRLAKGGGGKPGKGDTGGAAGHGNAAKTGSGQRSQGSAGSKPSKDWIKSLLD